MEVFIIMSKELPLTAEELVKELDVIYPEKCPSPEDSSKDIWMYAGQRELVRVLVQRLKVTQEKGV